MRKNFTVTLLSSTINERSGWGRFTRDFCLALYRKGIAFDLHLPFTEASSFDIPFAQAIYFDLPKPFLTIGRRWWIVPKLWWDSRKISVHGNLIHSLVEFPFAVLANWISHRYGLPFGLTVHGTYAVKPLLSFPEKWLYRSALRSADFIIAVSDFTKHRLTSIISIPVMVINSGVYFDYFSSLQMKYIDNRWRPTKDVQEKIVLCVGALKHRKGIDVLLHAFAEVVKEEPMVRLVIIGAGDKEPYLQMAEKLKISERVAFLGEISDEELLRYYQMCDVFMLLPREDEHDHFEGFGLVYLEANACGKPVIGTWSGGVPEAVQDGVTGFLVPPDSPKEAAMALLKLLRNENLCRTMGEAGRVWAQKHDWSEVVEQYIKIYEMVLERNKQTWDGNQL